MRPLLALALVGWLTAITACADLDQRMLSPHPTGWGVETRGNVALPVAMAAGIAAINAAVDGKDKQAHALAGFASSFGVGMLFKPRDGWVVGLSLGAAKEISDANGGGDPDLMDFAATAAGATFAWCITSECWRQQ